MKIAIIDNYDSFVFNLVRYVNEAASETIVQRNDQLNFAKIDECDAILLSPGPGIPSEAGQLLEVIDKYHSSKKILGVCLGHQALAEYFDGSISLTDPMHGKASFLNHTNESRLFNQVPEQFQAGRYHSWCVDQLPTSFVSTASTNDGKIMAMEHETLPVFGVQFHPESILTPEGRTIINNWIKA